MRATVLLVEDERRIREQIRRYLELAGLSVLSTDSGSGVIELADSSDVDIVILARGVPMVMLTARSGTQDRVVGLELGVDDSITKPFSARELALRAVQLRALLAALSGAPGRVFGRYELVNRMRGYEFEGSERIFDTHVKNLRHTIEADPKWPRIVTTVLGAGCRFERTRDDA